MELIGKKVGFILTGAFYMFKNTIAQIRELEKNEATIIPIMSSTVFENIKLQQQSFIMEIEKITNNKIIHTIAEIEPIGKKNITDILVIAPCTRKYYL